MGSQIYWKEFKKILEARISEYAVLFGAINYDGMYIFPDGTKKRLVISWCYDGILGDRPGVSLYVYMNQIDIMGSKWRTKTIISSKRKNELGECLIEKAVQGFFSEI